MPKLVIGSWYVVYRVNFGWVKIVNNMLINTCGFCVFVSTNRTNNQNLNDIACVKTLFIQSNIPTESTSFYTRLISKSNLLNKSFTYFPHKLLLNLIKIN